jgi:hypothetical protein
VCLCAHVLVDVSTFTTCVTLPRASESAFGECVALRLAPCVFTNFPRNPCGLVAGLPYHYSGFCYTARQYKGTLCTLTTLELVSSSLPPILISPFILNSVYSDAQYVLKNTLTIANNLNSYRADSNHASHDILSCFILRGCFRCSDSESVVT